MNCSMTEFAGAFRTHFPDMGGANQFLDPLLSRIRTQPVLDVVSFDDALHKKHGDRYPEDGMSTKEFVGQRYGPAAVAWLQVAMR